MAAHKSASALPRQPKRETGSFSQIDIRAPAKINQRSASIVPDSAHFDKLYNCLRALVHILARQAVRDLSARYESKGHDW
jgi:hypothetical protein